MSDLTLFSTGDSTARLSDCGTYRYELGRRWADGPIVTWVMLNPSTADATQDDRTIGRCIEFSKAWGFGGLVVVNLFAFRATEPAALKAADDPVGPENDAAISSAVEQAPLVVAAWGVHGGLVGRDRRVTELIEESGEVVCLGTTKDGYPCHPLYLKGDTERIPWPVRVYEEERADG